MRSAETFEEIKPLVDLCRAGRLYEVQDWISAGKPVNLPPPDKLKRAKPSPLQVSLERGFYSLVQLLLKNGATLEDARYLLSYALHKRRLDFIDLLARHGADLHAIHLEEVFETWNNDIVDYFIAKGADLLCGHPLASALCSRIRPALGIYMRYRERIPELKDQIDIALRHHCKQGNLKWVSLLLWAGADPESKGPDCPGDDDPESHVSALELAALYGHTGVFQLKKIRLNPVKDPEELFRYACLGGKPEILKILFEKGLSPDRLQDRGSSLIQLLIHRMSWDLDRFWTDGIRKDQDSYRSRDIMKMLHMLVRRGARWEPKDNGEINRCRRSLLRMKDDYTVEFVWIMSDYGACRRSDLEILMKPPSIRALVSNHIQRVQKMIESISGCL